MHSNKWHIATSLCLILACSTDCNAGKWAAVREGLEALGKKSVKFFRKGAEKSAVRAAPRRALLKGLETGAEKAGSRLGGKVAREAGKDAGTVAVRFGAHVATPVVSKFGDDGARALSSLSPKGAERLASMAGDLAASGRGKDWMKLIAERGDEVMEWLWKRRGSVAVGTIATAVLLQPEEFLRASEHVAASAMDATGKHVLEPLIAQGARHIAAPMAERAAAAIPWRTIWTIALLGLIPWWIWRRGLTMRMLWKFVREGRF